MSFPEGASRQSFLKKYPIPPLLKTDTVFLVSDFCENQNRAAFESLHPRVSVNPEMQHVSSQMFPTVSYCDASLPLPPKKSLFFFSSVFFFRRSFFCASSRCGANGTYYLAEAPPGGWSARVGGEESVRLDASCDFLYYNFSSKVKVIKNCSNSILDLA